MTARDNAGPDRPKKELTQAIADQVFEKRRRENERAAALLESKMLLFGKMNSWKERVLKGCPKGTPEHDVLVRRCGDATELFFRVIGVGLDSHKFAKVSGAFEGNPPPSPDEVIERLRNP